MKRLKLKKIDEMARIMPILSELERRNLLGGYHVVIETQRQASGSNSTWSTYTATAYDNCGSVVGTTTGYFLESTTNHDLETTAGSDTAIQAGTYTVSQNSNGVTN
ncbi:hypothetical protein FACS1894207_4650 [Bacteroidia bacterium]|nr:hypothetical protein FACS1894207_4650 [Bacteroidia bacterium]